MKLKIRLLIAYILTAAVGIAQTSDNRFSIGLNLTKSEYNGDYGNGIFNIGRKFYFGSGLVAGYYLNPSIDLGAHLNFGNYGYEKDQLDFFAGRKLEMNLYSHYKFDNGYILKADSKFSPFVSLGLGFASYSINPLNDKSNIIPGLSPQIITGSTDFIVPIGVGVKYKINNAFAVQYQYLYTITSADNHDETKGVTLSRKNGNDAYGEHLLSVVFAFGKGKDSDNDGVPDRKDKCPNTSPDTNVDEDGCPADSDHDGILDYLDKCNDTPEGVKVDMNGCALDADKDGVPDYQDRCPDTKGLPAFKGCPDTDNDGVPDKEDQCPAMAGTLATNGCPDADADGIIDSEDKCPQIAGSIQNNGCPELKADEKKLFDQAAYGIQFETGKEFITVSSYPILNQIVRIMKENSSYKLEINGYTDSLGDDIENLILSQSRANAVKNYLENAGVNASRLIATGYGEKDPISTNYTELGRTKNRRVEFIVYF